ncbi:MAG: MBL fold metallo-hydrolase [Alcanivoracaceae bacterium]|nr:MBL fold metallo-hydrolase [Alcanivoracaceae bacterium]
MKIHHLQGYIQNIYLVEQNDSLMLLDGCCRCDINSLKGYITQELNRPITDLKVVVVTHMHPDHAGAADKLRRLTGCIIISSNKHATWYQGIVGLIMFLTDLVLTLWVARRMGKPIKNVWYPRKLKIDLMLNDGDSIPDFKEWIILETPGHTNCDLSVLHLPSKTIYVADLVIKIKKMFISPFPIFHPNKYKNSLKKIDTLNVDSLLLAHGGEVAIKDMQLLNLIKGIPDKPKTHWRATRSKIKKLLDRF